MTADDPAVIDRRYSKASPVLCHNVAFQGPEDWWYEPNQSGEVREFSWRLPSSCF
jgi:hypothetical protein